MLQASPTTPVAAVGSAQRRQSHDGETKPRKCHCGWWCARGGHAYAGSAVRQPPDHSRFCSRGDQTMGIAIGDVVSQTSGNVTLTPQLPPQHPCRQDIAPTTWRCHSTVGWPENLTSGYYCSRRLCALQDPHRQTPAWIEGVRLPPIWGASLGQLRYVGVHPCGAGCLPERSMR